MATIIERDSGASSSAMTLIVAIIAIVAILGVALYALGYFPMANNAADDGTIDVNIEGQLPDTTTDDQ